MYFDTLKLLRLPPLQALLITLNQTWGTHFSPETVEVSGVTALEAEGTLTQVTLTARTTPGVVGMGTAPRYTGSRVVEFHRLPVAEVFGSPLRVILEPPVTSAVLLRLLGERSGIVFEEQDFTLEVIDDTLYSLQASPQSLRWVGGTQVMLETDDGLIDLERYFTVNTLAGFQQPVREDLAEVLAVKALPGFKIPLRNALRQPQLSGFHRDWESSWTTQQLSGFEPAE